jgi:cyclophilin family peptidyl-prolyl cis-trans isomerase
MLATGIDSFPDRAPLLTKGMHDGSPMVRFEALQAYGRKLQPSAGCEPILQALNDQSPHVVLLAVDLLGNGCKGAEGPQAADRLFALARQLTPAFVDRGNSPPPAWQQPAHAIVALARVVPDRADSLLPTFVDHTTWWVRVYAARAAATLKKNRVLEQLAYDANDNVREAAIRGLSRVEGHAADSISLAALSRPDYQLLITASQALDSTPNPAPAVAALTNALLRVTGENRETSRDTRMALLERIGTLGTAAQKSQIQVYLYDWDRVVAARTAAILSRWSGTAQQAAPNSLPFSPLPSLSGISQLAHSRVRFHMRGGASFEIALRAFDAPTNVDRFVRLVKAGYYDGLTIHRVVPNFVIQGGSPGANEYWGDGPYTRDELTTEEHVRGTVGISTRGRDTGDGQIFVNLVDNPRLDHNYTIIGEVVTGLETVDAVLEGATIEKVELISGER